MNDGDLLPTRVSYKFNLPRPEHQCADGLLDLARRGRARRAESIRVYRCDVALAGGVSITFRRIAGSFHLEGGILFEGWHCRTFDAQASGTVSGDGAGS